MLKVHMMYAISFILFEEIFLYIFRWCWMGRR